MSDVARRLKAKLQAAVRTIAPNWAIEVSSLLRRSSHLIRLKRRLGNEFTVEQLVDQTLECPLFREHQKRAELTALLLLIRDLKPRVLCEIGAGDGGTLFALCQVAPPDARILSLDIAYRWSHLRTAGLMKRGLQQLTCLAADSHSSETFNAVRNWLGQDVFEFLFIDGDHSYDGAFSDFKMYGPLVQRAGKIGFHDVVPDFRTRYGVRTKSDVGEVPRLWSILKQAYPSAKEFVEDPDQDGFGIGVIDWTGLQHLAQDG